MLYPPWVSWYLFILVLLMIPIDLIISLPGMLSRGMMMFAPPFLEKDDEAAVKIVTTQPKPYPVRCILAKLLVTGDGFSVMCNLICPAGNDEYREVTIDSSHSGVTFFELKKLSIVSMLGLFSLPVKVSVKKAVLIMPQPVKPVNAIALQRGLQLKPKPGGGFSEEHDMRQYRQGDPVRNIHWKASAKFDSLIIREPLVPPPHSRLVHIMPWETASDCDLILGRLRWISEFLLKWEMPFFVKYSDNPLVAEIMSGKDLIEFLCEILSPSEEDGKKPQYVPTRFSWVYRIDSSGYKKELQSSPSESTDENREVWK